MRQKGLTGEAIEAMRLAARLEPNSAVVFHDLGLICLEAGLQETTSVRGDFLVELREFEPLTSAVQALVRGDGAAASKR